MKLHFIRNAKIRTKLIGCLIILASTTAIIGFVANQNTTQINGQFKTIVDSNTPRLIALLQMKSSASEVEASLAELDAEAGGRQVTAKEEILANLEALQNNQSDYARHARTTPDKVADIASATDRVSTSAALLVSGLEQKTSAATVEGLQEELRGAVDDLVAKADHLIDSELYQLRSSNTSVNNSVAVQQKISVAVQLLALLFVVAIGILLTRLIVRPLARLRQKVNAIAKGNLDVKLPVHSTDEIGELTGAIDKLRITVKYLLDDTAEQEQAAKKESGQNKR